ncbi:MAG TPA: hydrolase TatD, partial [Planctomycetota bacterium]|nr:hydrolase TatD [Planctomycetota bacterium]
AAFTIYPGTKMGSERMVEVVKRYGSERIIVDSSADWGVSDPLSVPKTAQLMLERGLDAKLVEAVTWGNALAAYGQSGQIDLEALERTPTIDQSQLFGDSSVLRGQSPRIDQPVIN